MATTQPDPRTFESWNDAFQHPIPATRKFQQVLRNNAEQNRQKLRTIVGASYRDLLGTADLIISMDEQTRDVEKSLGVAGQQCNSKSIDRLFINAAHFQKVTALRNKKQLSFASQLDLLQNCTLVISRLLRKDESTLVASKVLVFARLLHKHLYQLEPSSQLIESLRSRLESLRRKIRLVIDRRLGDPDAPWRSLVDDMCAFSLTTNATPTDILRHFHTVRLSAIVSSVGGEQNDNSYAINPVKHLISTFRVSQAIFPKRLSDALGRLKDAPLLQNRDILLLEELDLKAHEPWIAEELRNYTPWPRHDELREAEAKKQVKSWAKQALGALTDGLRKNLEETSDFENVIRLREGVFQILPWSGKELPGLYVPDVIDEFRAIFNKRLGEILKLRAQRLDQLVTTLSGSFNQLGREPLPNHSLWDDDITSMDASNGATKLKTMIRSYCQGGDSISVAFIEEYDAWSDEMATLTSRIKALREDRWNDDLVDDLDDADSDLRRILLGEDDPKALEETFITHIQFSLQSLRDSLHDLVSQVSSSSTTTTTSTTTLSIPKAIITLRIIRSVLHHPLPIPTVHPPTLSHPSLTPLHTHLATHVTSSALTTYTTSLLFSTTTTTSSSSTASSSFSAPLLWEGNPPLPVQPAPAAYRLLRSVVAAMRDCGADVWAGGAVRAVKRVARGGVGEAVGSWLDVVVLADDGAEDTMMKKKKQQQQQQHGEGENGSLEREKDKEEEDDASSDRENGDEKGADDKDGDGGSRERRQQRATQLLFDVLYLSKALDTATVVGSGSGGGGGGDGGGDGIRYAIDALTKVAELDSAQVLRMERSAADYWRRTYLMFALLAS